MVVPTANKHELDNDPNYKHFHYLSINRTYITFNMEQAGVYEKEHARILNCVEELLDRVGRQRAGEIIQLFTLISDMADEVIT